MFTIGANFGTHDSCAALVGEDSVLAAYEEERFSSIKKDGSFPQESIEQCLAAVGVKKADIDRAGFYLSPWKHVWLGINTVRSTYLCSSALAPYAARLVLRAIRARRCLADYLFGGDVRRVKFLEHHRCHAAATFYQSGFERAAVLVVDGRGEYESLVGYRADIKSGLTKMFSVQFPNSVGYFYSAVTHFLGFRPQFDEYKVMGLASYGRENERSRRVREALFCDGRVKLQTEFFDFHRRHGQSRKWTTEAFANLVGFSRSEKGRTDSLAADVAWGAQQALEDAYLQYARQLCGITGERNLCVAGGVALNCVANQALARALPDVELFVHPAAHDAGTAIGAAILLNRVSRRTLVTPYLGKFKDNMEAGRSITAKVFRQVASDLSRGLIVGWFEGDMEIGPRALGHRNILARPDSKELADRVNRYVKKREGFRPLAPAVQREYFDEFFLRLANANRLYEYMLITADVKESVRNEICGVVHVDGTARPQSVCRETNVSLWHILEECRNCFGLPVLLSTSLNMAGKAMPARPRQALELLEEMALDVLYIDGKRHCKLA